MPVKKKKKGRVMQVKQGPYLLLFLLVQIFSQQNNLFLCIIMLCEEKHTHTSPPIHK